MKFLQNNKQQLKEVATLGDVTLAVQNDDSLSKYTRKDRLGRSILTKKSKEAFYTGEPLSSGAIDKTALLMTKEWFTMDSVKENESIDETLQDELFQFHRDVDLFGKFYYLIKESMKYGNGYLEIIPEIDDGDPSTPITPEMGVRDIVKADSMFFSDRVIPLNDGSWWYEEHKPGGEYIRHHSSRILHLPWFTSGNSVMGFGVYDKCFKSILQKTKMDWAVGEVIYRFGKPFVVLKTTGASKKELKKAYQILQRLNPKTGFAGTERHEFDILNPSAVDPDNFAKYYYINLASACEMPMMVLIGSQKGSVTGSEVDLRDWYGLLQAKQKLKLNPLIHKLNTLFTGGVWQDEIFWNPIFVDEKSDSEIFKVKADTLKVLYNDAGLVTDVEARQIARNWGFSIPEDDTEYLNDVEPVLPEDFEPYEEEDDGDE